MGIRIQVELAHLRPVRVDVAHISRLSATNLRAYTDNMVGKGMRPTAIVASVFKPAGMAPAVLFSGGLDSQAGCTTRVAERCSAQRLHDSGQVRLPEKGVGSSVTNKLCVHVQLGPKQVSLHAHACAATYHADSFKGSEIKWVDANVTNFMKKWDVPGVSITLAYKSTLHLSSAWGLQARYQP